MIKVRMRAGSAWSDALILNMSRSGLLVRSDRSPERGSFLEIRRGPNVMVARVIWSDSGRFGVQTQDPVPADELSGNPDGASSRAKPSGGCQERRAAPRSTWARHESSRHISRAAQFAAIALAAGLVAILAANAVAEVVARPLSAAQAAFASK